MGPSKQSVRPLANQFGNTNTSVELCLLEVAARGYRSVVSDW